MLWGACDALGTPRPLSPLIDIAAAVEGHLLASVCAAMTSRTRSSSRCVEELTRRAPTIAVIEDVHWADEATLDVIRLLARRAEALGALVVVTYREDELEADAPGAPRRGRARDGAGRRRSCACRRSRAHAVAASSPRPHGVDAGELYVKTAGNPFFVTEVLAGGGTDVPADGARCGARLG